MRAPKYLDLLVVAVVFTAKTSLVQGDEGRALDEPMCINKRKRLSSSFIECLNFPKNVQQERVKGCTRKFTRGWKKLSRDKPKKTAVCPASPPAGAITDLVPICGMASLDMGECQSLADTLIELSTTDETEKTTVCPEDEKVCPFGEVVFRDPNNNCEFPDCPPEPIFCTQDAKECPDGSFVSRDPSNGCAFKPCPAEKITTSCTEEGFVCPNGDVVFRDPNNNCEFPDCPPEPIFCTQDVQECPDGSFVGRDSNNGCAFRPCPACCDPYLDTGCQNCDRKCCADGSWSCPDENGQYLCNGLITPEPNGKECNCPCSAYLRFAKEKDDLTESSCKDMSQPMIYVKEDTEFSDGLGTFATINEDEEGGECAEGDAIVRILGGQAKVCIAEIADRCEELGSPIPNRQTSTISPHTFSPKRIYL